MSEYIGTVVFRYYKTIRVEAESLEEAEREMYSKFDLSKPIKSQKCLMFMKLRSKAMNLEDKSYSEVIDMLESIAEKHNLLLSQNLIDFADDVWDLATKAERQANALAKKYEDDDRLFKQGEIK